MHRAEVRAGASLVTATVALLVDIGAAALVGEIDVVVHEGVQVAHEVGGKRLVLDVDVPTGKAGGETSVLALLADGQGELVVGNDDGGVLVCLLYTSDAADEL